MADLKQIENYLERRKLPYKLIDLDQEAFTVADVVQAGVSEDEVVKTLVVRVGPNKFVALALRGSDRIDFKKVRKLFGSKSEFAKPDEVLKVVGVPVGAVCPILLEIPLYFDRKVMGLDKVHMGSGDLARGLEMRLSDLLKAVEKYEVLDLSCN